MAEKHEIKTEVHIPSSMGLDDKTKTELKKEFEAALQGVLSQNPITKAKHAVVALHWKSSDES
ncbi:MAG TPA: hypothetical protein VE178_19950 [Silvibacterium sp.]|nr:hypothetical protein [Silvibacterium sp.]